MLLCVYLYSEIFLTQDNLNVNWRVLHNVTIQLHGGSHGILKESQGILLEPFKWHRGRTY